MKQLFSILWISILIGVTALPSGCGSKEGDPGKEKAESGQAEEESPSGASFKPGKGIILTEETSKILGLTIADVTEEPLPQVVQWNVQIFGETHRFENLDKEHTGCDFHGSGFLPVDKAVLVKPKQIVKLLTSDKAVLEGFVVAVQEPLAHGEIEIIVGVKTAGNKLKDGEFVTATLAVPRSEQVMVMPRSALLRTSEGTFVYTVNGEAYYRTAVTAGSISDEKMEIIDGLYPGDQVVTKPVETLWIIELRATKGGGHSH